MAKQNRELGKGAFSITAEALRYDFEVPDEDEAGSGAKETAAGGEPRGDGESDVALGSDAGTKAAGGEEMSLEERINRCFDVSALACVLAALALCVSLVSCSVSAPDAPSDTAAHHSTQVTATKRLEAPDAAGNTADNSAAMGSTARDRIAGLADMWERESGSDGSKSEGAAEEALSIDNAPFTFDGASTIEEWYRLPEYAAATGDGWYLDENDVWRDGDGYVVLTASGTSHDMGDIIETSHGPGRVVSLAMPRISSYGVNGKVYEVVRVATAW